MTAIDANDPAFRFRRGKGHELEITIGRSFGRSFCLVLVVALFVLAALVTGQGEMLSIIWKFVGLVGW